MVLLAAALALQVQLQDPAVIARGDKIFAASCGIGYCHGKAGAASRGPRLAGRKLDRDYLFKVIAEGAGNGNMPAFAKQYSLDELWAVVAYILSLSDGETRAPAEVSAVARTGEPELPGRKVFQERCAVCHQHRGKGAEVGPDLTAQAGRRPEEIRRDILEPQARLSITPVIVVTKAGERVAGIKKQETSELLRVYDLSGLPPVLRTIYKDQIQSVTPDTESPMPGDFGKTLSQAELRDLVEFLSREY